MQVLKTPITKQSHGAAILKQVCRGNKKSSISLLFIIIQQYINNKHL